jgi:hypothetical protein
MTGAEWLAASEPELMLEFLRGKASDRKLRLFAVACCERVRTLITRNGNKAVRAAEEFADGLIDRHQLRDAWVSVGHVKGEARTFACFAAQGASCPPEYGTLSAAGYAVRAVVAHANPVDTDRVRQAEQAIQTVLLRDIFGNPFRPVVADPSWRTSAVVALAGQMYESRDFGEMPILADALEDAGCDNADVIAHCRGPGPHVRGCWVVDLVLGKT